MRHSHYHYRHLYQLEALQFDVENDNFARFYKVARVRFR